MKKVLFVATVVKTHIMVFHIPYLKWFKENGYETYVCARNDYENKDDCVIPYCDYYYDLPFERSPIRLNNFKTYKQLKEIIDSNGFDIIHCHTPMGGVLTRLAARNARKKNTTVIYTAHGFHFYKGAPILNWLVYYPVERWLSRLTDILVTINKEDYKRAQKFKAKSIEYVPGVGIDTKKINEIKVNIVKKRNEIGIPKDSTIVLSVGELNKNKNHETVIRAIAKLNNPDIYYVICGEGQLAIYLRNLAKELGISKQVKFLGFRTDIAEIIKISNVFAFPSFREGLSLSLMEAMTLGLPVICSNIRGNSDLVEHGKGGYLVKPDDIQGFTNAILNLYENSTKRKNMGIYNRSVLKNFDLQNVLEEMGNIYSKSYSRGNTKN
ncbi:glycosyltransferase family 4 protein [Neobacillus thermocopriae]|uniref:glycosyltransferase family 4 protein n=1 Tax=Neobacillus thermocopriae TaxID=1215031 RepID=UPI002E2091A6|nr:glycosyltransferase family 4 protein [Neobacillus thermocopriae]MED3713380.1 glycosyltransferase family 4 protein [Neobacillus thermocopriae]